MSSHDWRLAALLAIIVFADPTLGLSDELQCSPSSPLANGNMIVCWKTGAAIETPRHILIHFHGAPQTAKEALARSDLNAVLVVVNFPGLSTAYSKPFQLDPSLFQQIIDHAKISFSAAATLDKSDDWQRVSVSSFSAGYGAVREILKAPSNFDRIDAIVAADSIYAGLQQTEPDRQVDENNMSDFLKFASLAVDQTKTFVISHSALSTPYASTVETADYLLRSLQISRRRDTSIQTATMQQSSQASSGRFLVLGFDGVTGKDHMQHLHNIDLLWKRLSDR